MDQANAISVDIGRRIRELREARGISIRTLATSSGLSANAVSVIERGKSSPSVSTLYKLADALGIPITGFFGPESEKQNAILVKSDERPRVPFARGVWEGLGGERFTGRVEPFVLTLESGASSGPHTMAHGGHEFVYCLRGNLEYLVENQGYLLAAGDSLLFAAQLNHRWRNPGSIVTNVLLVLSGFSEGEDARAMHWKRAKAAPPTGP